MNILVAIAGSLLIMLTLWDVFIVMVLTRRATRQFQLTRGLVVLFRRSYEMVARLLHDTARRESILSLAGPLFLFLRFAVWAMGLILGYALLQWAAGSQMVSPQSAPSFFTVLYFSGTTFFTVTMGDVTPATQIPRFLSVAEGGTGFMFLGLVISYLPIFYQDYAQRESRLTMLDEWAGSPPSAGEMLRRLGDEQALEELKPFFKEWEAWCADLLESHLSYPILAFFRSQHENQSWVSALATVLDACALVLVGIEGVPTDAARRTFAMARHTAVDLSQTLGADVDGSEMDRLTPSELARLRDFLHAHCVAITRGQDADNELHRLRALYEPYLIGLAEVLYMPLPNWMPDERKLDNWQRTARDHTSGSAM